MSVFAANLKIIMDDRKLSAQEIAFMAGVRRGTIYHWLNGGPIRDKALLKLAKALKIDEAALRYGIAGFDKETLIKIFELIDNRCDAFGVILSTRQKVTIAHIIYRDYIRTHKLPSEEVIGDFIETASG